MVIILTHHTIRDIDYYKNTKKGPKRLRFIKNCEICGTEFITWPKIVNEGKGRFCSVKCRGISARGSKRDPEIGKRISKSNTGEKNHFYGKHHTPETRAKMSANHADFHGDKSPHFGKRGKDAIAYGEKNGMYGRPPPVGTSYGRGGYFTQPNGNIVWLRSTYETRVAEVITKIGITWLYESKYFKLDGLGTYHPDFYLPEYNIWLEIKGYVRKEARDKLTQFFIQYPNETLKILYIEDIIQLENAIRDQQEIDITQFGTTTIR